VPLPNGTKGLVEREKVVTYLLNPAHPEGAGKARFFFSLGFRPEWPQVLADALRRIARTGSVARFVETVHGAKYIVDGELTGPDGRAAQVRTIRITEPGKESPRLITAYPGKEWDYDNRRA
jgi:hypothetical protein